MSKFSHAIRVLAAWLVAGSIAAPGLSGADTPLERGAYLVRAVAACGNCHTPKGPDGHDLPDRELAGMAPFFVTPDYHANAPNITPDRDTGIGAWTDEQIMTAIREGRRPDGSIIGPPMPITLYRKMSDSDTRAIVAYLRSIPAVRNEIPPSEYRVALPHDYGPFNFPVPDISRRDPVAYGEYLAGPVAHCIECHSPMGENGHDIENRMGQGGFEFPGPWGVSVSPNITPAGIGHWSDDDLKTMITTGHRPDGSPMLPPMPYGYYANMTAEDLDAIVAWLRQIPAK